MSSKKPQINRQALYKFFFKPNKKVQRCHYFWISAPFLCCPLFILAISQVLGYDQQNGKQVSITTLVIQD